MEDLPSASLSTSSSFVPNAHKLKYIIHGWSSYSGNYHPNNILQDRPNDQSSRWSSDCNLPTQFITLKLEKPTIVTSITFGKYEKTHLCNLQKFKVFGGLNEASMMELFSGGLNNDSQKETFELRNKYDGRQFPCRLLKIIPLLAWGPNFNFSIWYISLDGIDETEYVRPRLKWFLNFREQEAVRMCLKYLRQNNFMDAYQALEKKSKINLEDPMLTELHRKLVLDGDFDGTEKILEESVNGGFFNEYVESQNYHPKWTPIVSVNENGLSNECQPGMRGGHQMCIDVDKQLVLLFGGWDGQQDLADFWLFDIKSKHWHCVSEDTLTDGGPSARSCHKICLDYKRRHLYVLGRYIESGERQQHQLNSDFYRYDLDNGTWHIISEDTLKEGGPCLIFDHQMVYDGVSDKIFVFGGRTLRGETSGATLGTQFSGLYSYHIESQTWSKIKDNCTNPTKADELRSRSGHSMMIDEDKRLLYILGGQIRKDHYLSDFLSYNIETEEICVFSSTAKDKEIPSAGYTQRSTMDVKTQEIFVLSGLCKDKDRKDETIPNSFWVYKIDKKKWCCIYKNENKSTRYWNKMHNVEPRPRFAHQLVYDPCTKVHFLFGGNPGHPSSKLRLDDFWELKLTPPTVEAALRRCKFELRKLRFLEMVETNQVEALAYLQSEVSIIVDHSNEKEREEFEELAASIFCQRLSENLSDEEDPSIPASVTVKDSTQKRRNKVFNDLTSRYPSRMIQPSQNLTDFVVFDLSNSD